MSNKVYENRKDIQAAAIKAWNPTKKGTLEIATSVGKTYIGIVVACTLINKKIINNCLIVVPTTNLVEQWKREIIKWGYSIDNIEIQCIQTAYKRKATYDLLLVDEIHTALGEKYSLVFENIEHKYCLGLSATVDKDNKVLMKYAPVVFTASVKDALEANSFNKYTIFNVEVPMSRKEKAVYTTFDKQFRIARLQLLLIKRDYPEYANLTIFDIAKIHNTSKEKTDIAKYSKMFWSSMSLRKNVCYNTVTKADLAIELVNRAPNKKWIVFAMSIKLAEYVKANIPNAVIYHSKQTIEEREKSLEDFAGNVSNCIIANKALDAGFNVESIDSAIAISGDSSEIRAGQRLGRVARIKETPSIFINLFSKDTQEKKWLEARNKKLDNIRWVTSSYIYNILGNTN